MTIMTTYRMVLWAYNPYSNVKVNSYVSEKAIQCWNSSNYKQSNILLHHRDLWVDQSVAYITSTNYFSSKLLTSFSESVVMSICPLRVLYEYFNVQFLWCYIIRLGRKGFPYFSSNINWISFCRHCPKYIQNGIEEYCWLLYYLYLHILLYRHTFTKAVFSTGSTRMTFKNKYILGKASK